MLERRRIVELYRGGTGQVLVTLVRAEGSSYRRPGARLLLGTGGVYAGTISGGCLEAEVTRKAMWLTRNGPVVERYSTLFDDTAEIPYGLGCGGTVDLLFERAGTPEANALVGAMEASLGGTGSAVISGLPSRGTDLTREVRGVGGEMLFRSAGFDPDAEVYREELEPPQRLIVLGAGDDARPVATIAAGLGWNVHLADGRPQMARRARFPQAAEVSVLGPAAEGLDRLGLAAEDAVVLMTHSYQQDRDCLAAILAAPEEPRYIGILGARHRTALLVAEAAELAGLPIAACCRRIHAPIGLDLGGDGAEAIALAIVAEVQACIHGKPAASRRLTPEEVAGQLALRGAASYQPAVCLAGLEAAD